jgi:hypothetical protein
MAYRNKTFVSFASEDIHYYWLMTAWNQNARLEFDFHDAHDLNTARDTSQPETICRRLRERLNNTKQVVMLLSDVTRRKAATPGTFLYYEANTIAEMDIPVIFANLNKSRSAQSARIPQSLLELYSISVPFGIYTIKFALDDFPNAYQQFKRSRVGPYCYKDEVYTDHRL